MHYNTYQQHQLLTGATVAIQILQGRNLIAKDRNLLGRRTTSDPYVKVYFGNKKYGNTSMIKANCNPVWNETLQMKLSPSEAKKLKDTPIELLIFDHDAVGEHDFMGAVQLNMLSACEQREPSWHAVGRKARSGRYDCHNASGELLIQVRVVATRALDIQRGQVHTLNRNIATQSNAGSKNLDRITVGLSWDVEKGKAVDLDTSCVAVDRSGRVRLEECVYYGNLTNKNLSLIHSGDETSGDAAGDDETIQMELDRIPSDIVALYVLLTVAGPSDTTLANVRSAQVCIRETATKTPLCRFVPAELGNYTALFLVRFARNTSNSREWVMTPISEGDEHARDFGSLIPMIKSYTRDLVPDVHVDPHERVAIMRKGGTIRVLDYVPGGAIPQTLTMGLSWDVTDGVNIDLDASAVLLDENLHQVDLVYFRQLTSKNGAIRHSGDEREGDEEGDDEKINICLNDIPANVMYIAFIVNSFSGQELDDISKASCHLFDPQSHAEVAKYTLSNSKELDKHTALIMACLYRTASEYTSEWDLCIISQPATGRMARENVDDLQQYLKRNPPPPPTVMPEQEIVLSAMPEVVPIVEGEEEIVVSGEDLKHYF